MGTGLVRGAMRLGRRGAEAVLSRVLQMPVRLVVQPAEPGLSDTGVHTLAAPQSELVEAAAAGLAPVPDAQPGASEAASSPRTKQADDAPMNWLARREPCRPLRTLLDNSHYRLAADRQGRLVFEAADGGESIVSALTLVVEWAGPSGLSREAAPIKLNTQRKRDGEGWTAFAGAATGGVECALVLTGHHASPMVNVRGRCVFLQPPPGHELVRLALVLDVEPEITELFSKNRQVLHPCGPERHWLDRQGLAIGAGKAAAVIYHTPAVSSLQADTGERRVIVNFDLSDDHPQIVDDPNGSYRNASRAAIRPLQALTGCFDLCLGARPKAMPRIMALPDGFTAAHVWTEHGCYTSYGTHYALYLGSDHITDVTKAKGGFVKHGIKTTKSVFFDNLVGALNDDQSELFKGDVASIKGNKAFEDNLIQLDKLGYEICLHCPQAASSSPEVIEGAVSYMNEVFNTRTWIDHFWYRPDGVKSGCFEAFCNCGLITPTIRRLWRDEQTRFFWNPAYEYLQTPHRRDPDDVVNHWNWDRALPNPVYWRHPTVGLEQAELAPTASPFVSWATWDSWYPREGQPRYDAASLDALVANWGIGIAHVYPTYVGEANRAWRRTDEGEVVVSMEFEDILARMAWLERQGLLLNTTIRDLLGYWLKLERVTWRYEPETAALVYENLGEEDILGFSIAFDLIGEDKAILLDGLTVEAKKRASSHVLSFDLPARGRRTLSGFDPS